MLKKIFFLFSFILIIFANLRSQEIVAVLDCSTLKKDSLIISLTLKNQSAQAYYLVGNFEYLELDDFFPILVNYGSFQKWLEYKRMDALEFLKEREEMSHIDDVYEIELPITKKRFQMDHNCNEMDIFEIISNLMDSDSILGFDSCEFVNKNRSEKEEFTDDFLFEFSKRLDPIKDYELLNLYRHAVTLHPNETKTIFIDLSYLLQQNATYLISFNFKTKDNLFKKEGKTLQKLGFKRFKGHITSNEIEIKSIKEVIP